MARKYFATEQIIHKIRESEIELAKTVEVGADCKKIGVTEQTYYRWRKE